MIGVRLTEKGYRVMVNLQRWACLTKEQRRDALLHELAHVVRGDCFRYDKPSPEARLFNLASDTVINATFPNILSIPWGVVDPQKVYDLLGCPPSTSAGILLALLKEHLGEKQADASAVEDLIRSVCREPDQEALKAVHQAENLHDLIPLPIHLRHWVVSRLEWVTEELSFAAQDVKEGQAGNGDGEGKDGNVADRITAHLKDLKDLKEAARSDGMEDSLPGSKGTQRALAGGKGGSKPWKPEQHKVVALSGIIREFLATYGEASRARCRSYRRQGRWMLYPSRPYTASKTFALFLDMSGSMYSHWEVMAGIARWAQAEGGRIYTFSDRVDQWHGGDFQAGGGTVYRPILQAIKKDKLGAAIIITDGYFMDRPEDPGVPVLWILTEKTQDKLPFGRIIDINQAAVIR